MNRDVWATKFLEEIEEDPLNERFGYYSNLIYAVINGYYDAVKYLIEAGADVNAKDRNGWRALKHAKVKFARESKKNYKDKTKLNDYCNIIELLENRLKMLGLKLK